MFVLSPRSASLPSVPTETSPHRDRADRCRGRSRECDHESIAAVPPRTAGRRQVAAQMLRPVDLDFTVGKGLAGVGGIDPRPSIPIRLLAPR